MFLCILGSAVLAVCGVFAQAASLRAAESEVYRILSARLSSVNAAGGGAMTARYGLVCMDSSQDGADVFDRLSEGIDGIRDASISFEMPLLEPSSLAEAICDHMRYRLPVILASQAMARIRSIADGLGSVGSVSGSSAESGVQKESGELIRDWLMSFDFSEFLKSGDESSPDTSDESVEEPEGDALEGLRSDIRAFLMDKILGEDLLRILQDVRSSLARLEREDGITGDGAFRFPDLFDPSAVSGFLSGMDDWFRLDADPLYRKCGLVEFIMGSCGRCMPESKSATGYEDGFGGRDLMAISAAEGPDVERIITGTDDPEAAAGWIYAAVLGIRFAVRAVSNISDPTRFGRAKTAAAAVAGVVTLISGGTVILPTEPLAVVIASAWSLAEAFGECDRLKSGEGVELCPGISAVTLIYNDYLRLFLYLVPDILMMERLSGTMARSVPGEFYRAATATACYGGRSYSLSVRCPS